MLIEPPTTTLLMASTTKLHSIFNYFLMSMWSPVFYRIQFKQIGKKALKTSKSILHISLILPLFIMLLSTVRHCSINIFRSATIEAFCKFNRIALIQPIRFIRQNDTIYNVTCALPLPRHSFCYWKQKKGRFSEKPKKSLQKDAMRLLLRWRYFVIPCKR